MNKKITVHAEAADQKISGGVAVDQFTGVGPSIDMYYDIHPNDKGEKTMTTLVYSDHSLYKKTQAISARL